MAGSTQPAQDDAAAGQAADAVDAVAQGGGIRSFLGPLALRDYRLFLGSSAAFSVGLWVQLTTMGWLALRLTDSAFLVSVVNVFWFIPFFVLALPAGVIADRFDRRRTVMLARSASVGVLFLMSFLTFSDQITYPWLLALTLLVGASISIELPARQSYVAMLVPPAQLVNAMALFQWNNGIFRLIGPLLAGFLVARMGEGGGFGLFAIFNVVFVLVMLIMRTPGKVEQAETRPPMEDLLDGLRYLRGHRDAFALVLTAILTGTMGWVYLALMPVVARDVLDGDALTLGLLGMAVGAGAMPGAIALAFYRDFPWAGRTYVAGLLLFGVCVTLFAYSQWFWVSMALLTLAGAGFGAQSILLTSTLLRVVETAYQGRVLGAMNLTWGANIIGTLAAGSVAETLGVSLAVGLSGVLIVVFTIVVVAFNPRLLRL